MSGLWRKLKKSLSLKQPSSSSSSSSPSSSSPPPSQQSKSSTGIATSAPPRPPPSSSSSSRRFSRSFSVQSSKIQKSCAICLGSLRSKQGQAIFTAECSHSFHFKCIADNVKHGHRICPICRSEWKEVPFQAPNSNVTDARHGNMGRSRVSPFITTPEELASEVRRNLRQPSPQTQRETEPDNFCDDEPLPVISKGTASSSHSQALTIRTFPELPAIPASDSSFKFGALVRVRAPPLCEDARSLDRAPIDLVTVLDVSGSMAGKLTLVKRAVQFIIQNLGPSDRLSVVVFSSTARRIFALRRMSEVGREDAIRVINSLSCSGGTNIVEGLKKGVRVLEDRREHNPVATIILLSDGQDTYNVDNNNRLRNLQSQASLSSRQKLEYLNLLPASINSERRADSLQPTIPVHTFGFGSEHDSTAMHAIADASHGTYSFIESIGILQDAFARCIGGLLSVVAQNVQLTIKSVSPYVKIKSVPSGKYKSEILDNQHKAVINIGDLYADEEKEFLVSISIQVSPATEGEKQTTLLDVLCSYKDSASMELAQVKGGRVKVRRPKVLSPADKIVCLEVDRQKNRLLVAAGIAEAQRLAETGDLEGAQALLAERRLALLSSASAQAGDSLCNWLEGELREIGGRMANLDLYEHTGRAYILAGLSSHSWQRATTRGDSTTQVSTREGNNSSRSATTSYETPSMVNMVSRSQILSSSSGIGQQPSRRNR